MTRGGLRKLCAGKLRADFSFSTSAVGREAIQLGGEFGRSEKLGLAHKVLQNLWRSV